MGLTDKQQRFVEEYVVDLNATQAAIRAGYSEKTADVIGCENLGKPKIARAIQERKQARSERTKVTADYVVTNLVEVTERCMQRAPVMEGRGRDRRQAIDSEGRHVWQFDSRGATRALNLLGKHMAMFTDRRSEEFGGEPVSLTEVVVEHEDDG